MYKPAPKRPKRTNITRSRAGCATCRRRRVKCDEQKPSCGPCLKSERICEARKPKLEFRSAFPGKEAQPCSQGSASPRQAHGIEPRQIHTNNELDTDTPLIQSGDGDVQLQGPVSGGSSSLVVPSPSPGTEILMHFNRSEREQVYITHWESSCIGALGKTFLIVTTLADVDQPLKHSLLALSACNLSRSRPEQSVTQGQRVLYSPKQDHLLACQRYYSAAVGQIARIIRNATNLTSPSLTLATLVFFCYTESAMGNFEAFAYHSQGISKIVELYLGQLSSDSLGPKLIAAWLQAKYQNWWLRLYFSTFSFQADQEPLSLPQDMMLILRVAEARRTVVASIFSESHRLDITAALLHFRQSEPPGFKDHLREDEYISRLAAESKKLDEWHAQLPLSDLPIESFPTSLAGAQRGSEAMHIRPLYFHCHEMALNYVYYIAARIMQCIPPLQSLQQAPIPRLNATEPTDETDYWMRLLIRIAAGMDKAECAKKNVYSIGLSSVLVACSLRCHDPELGKWVQEWLGECLLLDIIEEGSFPVKQAFEAVRVINNQRRLGRRVYLIGLPEEDGGGGGKYFSYQSQKVLSFVLKGRVEESGQLYTESVSVAMDT